MGCGYIGKKMAEMILRDKKYSLSCFVNSDASRDSCIARGFQTEQIDLDSHNIQLNNQSIAALENSLIAYLVPPQPKGETDNRMQKFVKLLESLAVPPQKILLISTTGVYGNCNGKWINEQQADNPQADRARRRLSAEKQLNAYCEKAQVKLIIFRVPGIYAADKLPLKRISSGEPIVTAQDSGFTNRIHADDLAAFSVEALCENIEPGKYNCCDGQPSTMNDYFMKVADAMNLPHPREISLQQAQQELSAGMLSYLAESKRISNEKLLSHFKTKFIYPNLAAGLKPLLKIQN